MRIEKYYEKGKTDELNIAIRRRVKLNSIYRDKFDSFFGFINIVIFIRCRSPPLFNLILKTN